MDTKALKREVRRLGPARRGRRFPGELRQRLAGAARALRGGGAGYEAIGKELGISAETARRMLMAKASTPLLPVQVVGSPEPVLVLRGPCGVVVEGLSAEQLASVLRALS